MSSDELARLLRATPARLAVGRAGTRPRTESALAFRADHARARDAVHGAFGDAFLAALRERGFLLVRSAAPDKATYLRRPDLGRALAEGEAARIVAARVPGAVAQIVVSDGLSARAAETQLARVWPALERGLARLGPLAQPVAVTLGRVAIADRVCEASGARLAVHLIGERPGLRAAESLGCYVTLAPHAGTTDADRKCISNVHARGLPPDEAGAAIVELCEKVLRAGSSGTSVAL